MGMFDNVECNVPLPDGLVSTFQTKDFACEMDTYTITKGGRLWRRYISAYEDVPESEWTHHNPTNALEAIWHENSKQRVVYSECDMNFHGILKFYTHVGNRDAGTWKWHEYRAKFTDGNLFEIVALEYAED